MELDYVLAYYRLEKCNFWAPAFKIVNTGLTTLRSYSVEAKDKTHKTTLTTSRNDFSQRRGCTVVNDISSLDPGEVGYIYTKNFTYNPTGDDFTVTVTACTKDDQSGKCSTQAIKFTP